MFLFCRYSRFVLARIPAHVSYPSDSAFSTMKLPINPPAPVTSIIAESLI